MVRRTPAPRATPPAGWSNDAAALHARAPKCAVAEWLALSPNLVFVRADARSSCPFGLGGVMRRRGGALVPVATARLDADSNVVVTRAEGTAWVGTGFDMKVEDLYRVAGDELVRVPLPALATDVFALGDRLWVKTLDKLFVHGDGAWNPVALCPGTPYEVQALDDSHALFRCAEAKTLAYDAGQQSRPLALTSPITSLHGAFVRGFWILDASKGSVWFAGGAAMPRREAFMCAHGPLRFVSATP
jgi:hypothetical protein